MFSVTRMEASCISRAWPASDSATLLVVAMARLTLSSEREARCETAIPESIESEDVRIAWAAATVCRLMSLKNLGDLFGRNGAAFGQLPDFVGDDGEAATMLAGASGLGGWFGRGPMWGFVDRLLLEL
jgi:hypothetical protein